MSSFKHNPKKRFGQNFLNDISVIQGIVDAIAPHQDKHLLEIGPGQGALTVPVLQQAKRLLALELDRDLIANLTKLCQPYGDLTLIQEDALKVDLSDIAANAGDLTVFGNLPYNISTPLIFHCLSHIQHIREMVFMLQKEVVDRLAAVPNTKQYGRLSIMVQYHCFVEALFTVGPESFDPPPKVHSAIVRLIPREQPEVLAKDYAHFAQLVNTAFTARRKTIGNALRKSLDMTSFEKAGIDKSLRAENLAVADFVRLSNVAVG